MPPRKRDAARMLRFHYALWCVRVWVRGSPDEKLLVLGQYRLHELVDDVVGFLLDECGVGVQRLVVVPVQTRTVLHEVLPARPRLDDWHDNLLHLLVTTRLPSRSRAVWRDDGGRLVRA